MGSPVFGEQRLVAGNRGVAERLLFQIMGVGDPAHYLHWRYLKEAVDSVPNLEPRRILDAGCGSGDHSIYLARRFPGAQVVSIDVDRGLVEKVRNTVAALQIRNVHPEVADLATFRSAQPFDLIVSVDVLEHIVAQEQALANLCNALVPGGTAFLHVPTVRERPVPFARWLREFQAWAEREHVARERTADEFVALVARHLDIRSTKRTFGYYTGELATSLFALPYRNHALNRLLQGALAPVCRLLVLADEWDPGRWRYAVAVTATRARPA